MENTETIVENLTLNTEKRFTQVKNDLKAIFEYLKIQISAINYAKTTEALDIATELNSKADPGLEWKVMTVNGKSTLKVLEYVSVSIQALYDHINKRIRFNLGYADKFEDFHTKNGLLVKYLEILIGKLDVQYENQISTYNLYLLEILYSFITEVFSINDTSK
jgi:hypothetical protein